MGDKGILTKEVEQKLGKTLDDLVKLGGVWETVDGLAFKLAISGLDDLLGEKIPEPYKSEIRGLIINIIEEQDYEEAVEQAFYFIDTIVDIPGMDDEMESLIFTGLAQIVIGVLVSLKKDEA